MKKIILLTVLLLVWVTGSSYYYVCYIRHHCDESRLTNMSLAELIAQPTGSLRIAGEDLVLTTDQGIQFARSGDVPFVPSEADTLLGQVAAYLQTHSEKALYITGWYDNTERAPVLIKNLGLARAQAVKKRLAAQGVPSDQIGIEAASSVNLTFARDTLLDGLTFRLADERPDTTPSLINATALDSLRQRVEGASPTVYFSTGATELVLSDSLQRYLQDVKVYLSAFPDKSIVLTGHTDNVGDAKKNLVYGQERADFTKKMLSTMDISPSSIKTRSQGEEQPIASNDTAEGRRRNRRVEIKVE